MESRNADFAARLIALIGKSIGNLDFKITVGCIDSRHVPPFSMFFALKVENTDGHLFSMKRSPRELISYHRASHPNRIPYSGYPRGNSSTPISAAFQPAGVNTLQALAKISRLLRRQFDLKSCGITWQRRQKLQPKSLPPVCFLSAILH
jgi:UDP-N-acetylmuramyl pentapeptide synthase